MKTATGSKTLTSRWALDDAVEAASSKVNRPGRLEPPRVRRSTSTALCKAFKFTTLAITFS